jgi:hypothetical protein
VSDPRDDDEFERIRLTAQVERDRQMIAQYDEHQAFFRDRVEKNLYLLGRLDERLGG